MPTENCRVGSSANRSCPNHLLIRSFLHFATDLLFLSFIATHFDFDDQRDLRTGKPRTGIGSKESTGRQDGPILQGMIRFVRGETVTFDDEVVGCCGCSWVGELWMHCICPQSQQSNLEISSYSLGPRDLVVS